MHTSEWVLDPKRSVAELQVEASARGLPTKGRKDDLRMRILEDIEQSQKAEENGEVTEPSTVTVVKEMLIKTSSFQTGLILLAMLTILVAYLAFGRGSFHLTVQSSSTDQLEETIVSALRQSNDRIAAIEQELQSEEVEPEADEENGEKAETPSPTATPTAEGDEPEKSADTGSMPEFVGEFSQGSWTVKGSERLDENPVVEDWISRLRDPAPELWKTYPNVPNPDVPEFRVVNGSEVPDGAEYGVANVPFCQQDTRCDFVVPGWHYRLITADYNFLGEECRGATNGGCLLLLINVGKETYTWRNQMADNGFSVPGRYWNGDSLEWAVWGLVSHASANMLNMPTEGLEGESLNSGLPANAGGNCGIVDGCNTVNVRVVVHAGDAIIAVLETEVKRP